MSSPGDVLAHAGITSTVALVRYLKTSPAKATPSAIDVAAAAWNASSSALFVPDKGLLLADWLVSTLTPRAQAAAGPKGKGKKPSNNEESEDDRLPYWDLLKRILAAEPQLASILASRYAAALVRAAEVFAARIQKLAEANSYALAASVGPVLGALIDPTISAGATTATARERLPSLAEAVAKLLSVAARLPSSETDAGVGIDRVLQSVLASYIPAFAQAAPARREAGMDIALRSFDDCAALSAREPPKQTGKRKRSSSDDVPTSLASHAHSFIYDTFLLPDMLRTVLGTPEKMDELQRVIEGAASGTQALSLGPDLIMTLTMRMRALPIDLPKKEDTIRMALRQFISQLVSAAGTADPERSLLLARTILAASSVGLYRPGPDFDGKGTSWASLVSTVLEGSVARLVRPGVEGRAADLRAVHALWTVDSSLVSHKLGAILRALWLTVDHESITAAEPLLRAIFDTARRARGVPQLAVALIEAAHEAASLVPDVLGSVSVPLMSWAIILRAEALQSLPAPLAVGLVQTLAQRQSKFAQAEKRSWAVEACLAAQILHTATLVPDAGGLHAWVEAYNAAGHFTSRLQQIKKVKQTEDEAVVRATLAFWDSAEASLMRAKSAMPPSPVAQETYLADMESLFKVTQSINPFLPHLHNIFKSATNNALRLDLADTLLRCAISGQASDPSKIVASVIESVESPDPAMSLGMWHMVARWADGLNRFPPEVLAPVARGIVKAWDGSEERQLHILRLTAGNAQFVELASFRDAIVQAALETSSKPVRDASKLAGARHFPRLYWGSALPQIHAAARKADAILVANGSFLVAGHVRELLAQTQKGGLLFSPEELLEFVASATKVKDLRPQTALFVRAWVSAQSDRNGGQDVIKAARSLLAQHSWVLYTFTSSVMRQLGRNHSELLSVDESAFTRARQAIKSFSPDATDDKVLALERAVRDAAVSCVLTQGKGLALPATFVSSLAAERTKSPSRARVWDGLLLSILELLVASGQTDELVKAYVYVREAVYLSGVAGQGELHSTIYRSGLTVLAPEEQATLFRTLTQMFEQDLSAYLATSSPGLVARVAARVDALVGCIAVLKESEVAQSATLRLFSTAAMVLTGKGAAPMLTLAFASAAASLVRSHHGLFGHSHVQQLMALCAGILTPASSPAAAPLDATRTVEVLTHILTALGLIMRQRRKTLRNSLPCLGGILTLIFPLLKVGGSGPKPSWMGKIDAPATVQLATSLSRTLEAITTKAMVLREVSRSTSLAEGFAPHAHALLQAYARCLLGVEEVSRNPLDRPAVVPLSGHVPPETQRALEPGVFALCDAATLAPAGREMALKFHLTPPAKAVIKRIWSAWEAQRYKGQ